MYSNKNQVHYDWNHCVLKPIKSRSCNDSICGYLSMESRYIDGIGMSPKPVNSEQKTTYAKYEKQNMFGLRMMVQKNEKI